jgi:hypothetical protein
MPPTDVRSDGHEVSRPSRVRTFLALLAGVLLLCGGLVSGVEDHRSLDDDAYSLGDCVPTGPRRTVEEINRFIDTTAGVPDFLGADVGVDVRLPEGRSVWLFADTLRRTPQGYRLVRNSMLLFSADCVQVVAAPGGGAVVPDREDGVGYWTMSAWRRGPDAAPTIYVMLQRVAAARGVGFGFVTLGPALAVFDITPAGRPTLRTRLDLGPDDPSGQGPEWGAASALADGWLYLYGTSTRDLPGVHGFALYVARVRPDAVADQSRWRYWDGVAWRAEARDAAVLIPEPGGVSQTLSVWRQEGLWYVLSKQDEFLGTTIAVWTARSPVGPFGPPAAVGDLPCDPTTGELRYMPLAHPGLLPLPGTVVISYSRNYFSLETVCAEPSLYRPYFLRVALPH